MGDGRGCCVRGIWDGGERKGWGVKGKERRGGVMEVSEAWVTMYGM